MNGSLHLGHAFTITKIEFAAGYQRLLGKRVLFPHGFHVTGMPIKVSDLIMGLLTEILTRAQASADKIIREMEMFGRDFEDYERHATMEKEKSSTQNAQVAVGKATKGKIAAKSTGLTYQFQIMESIGVPRSEIKKFADPYHWLTYFPPICIVSAMR